MVAVKLQFGYPNWKKISSLLVRLAKGWATALISSSHGIKHLKHAGKGACRLDRGTRVGSKLTWAACCYWKCQVNSLDLLLSGSMAPNQPCQFRSYVLRHRAIPFPFKRIMWCKLIPCQAATVLLYHMNSIMWSKQTHVMRSTEGRELFNTPKQMYVSPLVTKLTMFFESSTKHENAADDLVTP